MTRSVNGKGDHFTVNSATGAVIHHGYDRGALSLVHFAKDVLVLREEGHHFWTGIGQPARYAGVQYHVIDVESVSMDGLDADLNVSVVGEIVATYDLRNPRTAPSMARLVRAAEENR